MEKIKLLEIEPQETWQDKAVVARVVKLERCDYCREILVIPRDLHRQLEANGELRNKQYDDFFVSSNLRFSCGRDHHDAYSLCILSA